MLQRTCLFRLHKIEKRQPAGQLVGRHRVPIPVELLPICGLMNGSPEPAANATREVGLIVHHETGDHLAASAAVDIRFLFLQPVAERGKNFFDKRQDFDGVQIARECQVVGVTGVGDAIVTGSLCDRRVSSAQNEISNGRAGGRPGGKRAIVATKIRDNVLGGF